MKITKKQLRKLIQEEFAEVNSLSISQKIIIDIEDILDKKMQKPSMHNSTNQDQVILKVADFLITKGNQLKQEVKKFNS